MANPFTANQAPAAMQMIAPDLAAQQMQLSRQQKIADMLREQSMTPMGDTQTIGGWAIKKSPIEGLAKLAQALGANYSQNKTDENQLALSKSYQGRLADAINGKASADVAAPMALGAGATAQPSTPDASGEMVNQGGVGPTLGNALRMDSMTKAPSATPDNFNMANAVRGQAYEAIGGESAGRAFWDNLKSTEGMKTDKYLGITPDQSRTSELAKRLKEGTQSLQPNQTNIYPDGSKFVAPNFETGVAGGFDAQGNPFANAVPGASMIAANRAGAIKQAESGVADNFAVPAPVDAAGGKVALTPAQQRSAANNGVDPATSGGITNPGNMRPPGASTGFASYATPQDGLAALDKNLQSYGKQGVNTISAIIGKWAPPNENNTAAYVADVSKRLGVSPGQPLDMNNPIVRQALSTAITLHEHGPSKVFAQAGIPLRSDVQKATEEAAVKLATQPAIDMKVKEAGDMADYGKTLNGHLSDSQALLQRIEQSRNAMTKFQAGGGGETRSQLASFAQAIPGMPTSMVDRIAGGDLSASQEFQKYAAQEALGTMQQALASDTGKGSQGNRVAMQLFIKNNPNIDTDPRAIEKIFNFQTDQHNKLLEQSNAYQQYKDTPGNDPSKFPNYWAGEAIKRGYVKPEIKSGYAKGVPANVQSLLDKYK